MSLCRAGSYLAFMPRQMHSSVNKILCGIVLARSVADLQVGTGYVGNFFYTIAFCSAEITGGLLNATFGNAVEMIISVQAMRIVSTKFPM